jgi:hypothetical protein
VKRVLAAASAGLIAAVLLAGCGGGGGAATPSGPPLTKAEYRTKVSETVTSVRARYGNLSIDPTKISPGELAMVEQALR